MKISVPDEGIEILFGSRDENLKQLESQFGVQIRTDGHELIVSGDAEGVTKTCLLYTSPSPRDRTRSRMPSSA